MLADWHCLTPMTTRPAKMVAWVGVIFTPTSIMDITVALYPLHPSGETISHIALILYYFFILFFSLIQLKRCWSAWFFFALFEDHMSFFAQLLWSCNQGHVIFLCFLNQMGVLNASDCDKPSLLPWLPPANRRATWDVKAGKQIINTPLLK